MVWAAARVRRLLVLGMLVLLTIAVVAGWAERQRASVGSQPWLVPMVGLFMVSCAAAMKGSLLPRALLVATGVSWLLGSLSAWLLVAHQAVLLLVLIAVAGPIGRWVWLVAGLAIPISLGMLAQPAVGIVFLAVGVGVFVRRRTPTSAGAGVACGLVGGTLLVSWWISRVDPGAFDPYGALLVYEGVLVVAIGALVLGSRAEAARAGRLVDALVAGAGSTGLTGLGEVLAEALRAPGLRVLRPPVPQQAGDDLLVEVGGRTVAVVRHPVVSTLDATISEGVAAAVRLVVLGEERRAVLDARVWALQEAQRRIVGAQDEQRVETAARLRREVVAPLRAAAAALDGMAAPGDPVAADAVSAARAQILDATAEVEELVAGAGPRALGDGRLVDALNDVVARSPVVVDLRVEGGVSAPADVETVLYYVCAEALVNVHRHANGASAAVVLEEDDAVVRMTISDDGVGGADAQGSGLTGLADRAALHDGRLRVVSPSGAGTVVIVEIPRRGPGQSATRCHGARL